MTRNKKKILLHDSTNMYWRKISLNEKKHEKKVELSASNNFSIFCPWRKERKKKLKFLLRLHKKDSHLLEILWWQTNERDFKHRKHYLGDCYIKKQVCNFFFNEKCFEHFFSLLFFSASSSLSISSFISSNLPLYSSLCRYRINKKKKCLYLREPLFQFLGLCTIVENQKKKKSNINTK